MAQITFFINEFHTPHLKFASRLHPRSESPTALLPPVVKQHSTLNPTPKHTLKREKEKRGEKSFLPPPPTQLTPRRNSVRPELRPSVRPPSVGSEARVLSFPDQCLCSRRAPPPLAPAIPLSPLPQSASRMGLGSAAAHHDAVWLRGAVRRWVALSVE